MNAATIHVPAAPCDQLEVNLLGPHEIPCALPDSASGLSWDDGLRWLTILREGLGHIPYCAQATLQGRTCGVLPLALVRSALFGRFLVSLPYVNSAGPIAASHPIAHELIHKAVELADELDVRYLELRQESKADHPALTETNNSKVLMRHSLPTTSEELWQGFKSKLRSQIKAGQKHGFETRWGGRELLDDFYAVFSRNMRDLGTPVYPSRLFAEILRAFGQRAEMCVLRHRSKPIAAALLVHYDGVTEVPSASSLRSHNATGANMVMYWQLLSRAIERRQKTFDFGRSTVGSGTYRFKEQWGAEPRPSVWQYYVRRGSINHMRPGNSRYGLAIELWRRLPLPLANLMGPAIVRGIP